MRTKREFIEDFVLARATSEVFVLNKDAVSSYTEMAVAIWNAMEIAAPLPKPPVGYCHLPHW